MSWEVPDMRSKTSCFNGALSKNLLRRFWPLWLGWPVWLLLFMSTVLSRDSSYYRDIPNGSGGLEAAWQLMNIAAPGAVIGGALFAILAAMCVFSFLYTTRGCGMICSLPLRRETVFATVWATGLAPLLAGSALAALLALPFALRLGIAPLYLLWVFVLSALCAVAFYGIAVFCAMLTGSLVILPVIYGLLNLAGYAVQLAAGRLMGQFVYGYAGKLIIGDSWLSPVVMLGIKLNYVPVRDLEGNMIGLHAQGVAPLILYFAVGLALSALALVLYRRREMERATDTAAFPALRPLFRWCMSLGTALVGASVLYNIFFSSDGWNGNMAPVVALLLVVGAVLGWIAAQMILEKSVRVFKKGPWKGCAVICLLLIAGVTCLELDVFGIERRVPAAEEIVSVELNGFSENCQINLEQPESVAQALALHRQIIANKTVNEAKPARIRSLRFRYNLTNGKILERSYDLAWNEQTAANPASDLGAAQELFNCREARRERFVSGPAGKEFDLFEEELERELLFVELSYTNASGRYDTQYLYDADAVDFVRDCLLPDAEDGAVGVAWFFQGDEYYAKATNVSITLELNRPWEAESSQAWYRFDLLTDAERCCRWIEERTDIQIQTLGELYPDHSLW